MTGWWRAWANTWRASPRGTRWCPRSWHSATTVRTAGRREATCAPSTGSQCGRGCRETAPPGSSTTRRALHHFLGVSSISEYTVVDVTQVVKVDPAVPPPTACLLSCGATTGVGAAWKLAKVEPGSLVAIFGLGAVGLVVAEGARICGVSMIIGVDLNPEKHELGKKFSVTHFINPRELGEQPVSQAIIEMTDGGADYCFECIGVAALMNDAFWSSWDGWGKTIILGVEMHGTPFSIPSLEILHGKCVMGSLFGGVKAKAGDSNSCREVSEQGAGVGQVHNSRGCPEGHQQGL